jgi:hypothetical protein
MRVRKPSNSGGVNKFIGKFPSFRLNLILFFESILERDFLYLLEFDHFDVVSFHDQPRRIRYRFNGKIYSYTPDFYVERKNKRQLVEVKPEQKAFDKKNRIRYEAASQACAREGCEFIVATDTMIRIQPRLDNIKLLLKYQRIPIYPQHQIFCHEFFGGRREASLGQVMEFFAAQGVEKQVVYSLIRWGILSVDLMVPVDADSVATMAGGSSVERMVL